MSRNNGFIQCVCFLQMDPVMGTHQRDVPILCIPGIHHS
ncbi:unnamed protein product, partial [Staurois parvus]